MVFPPGKHTHIRGCQTFYLFKYSHTCWLIIFHHSDPTAVTGSHHRVAAETDLCSSSSPLTCFLLPVHALLTVSSHCFSTSFKTSSHFFSFLHFFSLPSSFFLLSFHPSLVHTILPSRCPFSPSSLHLIPPCLLLPTLVPRSSFSGPSLI